MATPGQPTSYKPEYDELARNYCLLGATNEALGDFFGVTRRAIQNWIATHPDFAEAVGRGRAVTAGESMRHADNCAGVHPLGETQKNDRRKGRKGRKPPILRK